MIKTTTHDCLTSLLVAGVLFLGLGSGSAAAENRTSPVSVPLRERCVAILHENLNQPDFALVAEAAQCLLGLEYRQGVLERIEPLRARLETRPHDRVRLWQVLARAAWRSEQRQEWIDKLQAVAKNPGAPDRDAGARALETLSATAAPAPTSTHTLALTELTAALDDPDPGRRAAAASVILHLDRRTQSALTGLDWGVIALYFIGMLLVGWLVMRRNRSTEDYLLGGRRMSPLAVGISLFATIFSSLTFLAFPGEVILNGPMILTQCLVFPLVFLAIGWLIIPYLMSLRITSAYEILETRFGLSVRMLASLMFLTLRLLWMSVIIYATTTEILIPIMNIRPAMTPWVCLGLGVLTLTYTSIGGFRAVVITDVLQAAILFLGAVLAIVLISVKLGGVGAWIPTQWAPHWEAPRWGFHAQGRLSLGMLFLATFLWHVCTSGSDQMAIQRYLATRNARAARGVVASSLISLALVYAFLGLLGCALLAFFRANPHTLRDGQSILGNSDQLLSRYMAYVMPSGCSGIMVAGLLAAAMSSLASGISSSCSVIMVDYIGRFRKTEISEQKNFVLAKTVSWVIGGVVIGMSLVMNAVPGNLLEICYRVVNLLTAPLFVVFALTMFVPWATPCGTWIGTLASIAAACLIAFWEILFGKKGISFLWIMPGSLAVGLLVGALASLLPIGPQALGTLPRVQAPEAQQREPSHAPTVD